VGDAVAGSLSKKALPRPQNRSLHPRFNAEAMGAAVGSGEILGRGWSAVLE